jgi:hypothetical protein
MSRFLELGSFPSLRNVAIVVDITYAFTARQARPALAHLDKSLVGLACRDKITTLAIVVPHGGAWVQWLDVSQTGRRCVERMLTHIVNLELATQNSHFKFRAKIPRFLPGWLALFPSLQEIRMPDFLDSTDQSRITFVRAIGDKCPYMKMVEIGHTAYVTSECRSR